MHFCRFHSLFALLLALSPAACGSLFPDSTPISYWTLRPAEVPLTGVRTLNIAPKTATPETQVAARLHDDLLVTERFTINGGAAQAMVSVGTEIVDLTAQVEAAAVPQDYAPLTRYTRWFSYTLRGTLHAVDTQSSKVLATMHRELPIKQACGTLTLPGVPPASGQGDPSLFAGSPACAVGNAAIASLGRLLAQGLVPHYEMETAQLYTDDLEHAKQAAKAFKAGNAVEAEAFLRVDLERASAKTNHDSQAKASLNLAILLNATGQIERAAEQLKNTQGLRDSQAFKLAELSIGRATAAQAQATSSGYTPRQLPSLEAQDESGVQSSSAALRTVASDEIKGLAAEEKTAVALAQLAQRAATERSFGDYVLIQERLHTELLAQLQNTFDLGTVQLSAHGQAMQAALQGLQGESLAARYYALQRPWQKAVLQRLSEAHVPGPYAAAAQQRWGRDLAALEALDRS